MTALIIALAAAVVGVLVVVVVGQRRRAPGRPRRANGADELKQAQLELRWARQLSALSETLDLDELLSRVLQGAAQLANGDASAVALWGKGEPPIVKAMNLTSDEALPLLGSWPAESRSRALTVRYRFPGETIAANAVQLGVLLPLSSEPGSPTGTLGIFWRRAADEPGDETLATLEELALAAGRAIENARQFRELHELAVRDPLTGLHNRRYFHETLAHEVKRAHRYDRRLAMLFFDLDDFKAINEEIGHLGGDSVLAEVAQRLRLVVRGADIPCRVGGDEFSVIMPESGIEQAEQLFGRLQATISGRPIEQAGRLDISAGVAELKPDDDSISFFERSDDALYRAKEAGKGQSVTADGGRAPA